MQYEHMLNLMKGLTQYTSPREFLQKFQMSSEHSVRKLKKPTTPLAYGSRKMSKAQVRITPGVGNIIINEKTLSDYFPRLNDRQQVLFPLHLTGNLGKFDVFANVTGGGATGIN